MPIQIPQSLQICIMYEIKVHTKLACRELIKVIEEKIETQQKYTNYLQEKSEVKEKVDRALKEKNVVKEREKKALKEKDEAKKMAHRIQTVVQKLYKAISKVPTVVEAIMEEHVSRIDEVIKGLCTRIEDMQSRSTPGTLPEERAGRERSAMTAVANIKKLDKECAKLCEESVQIWTNIMEDPEMNVVEARLWDVQEKAQKTSKSIKTLSSIERMATILAQRQSYNEIKKIQDQ
jgi:hypothetical protein